MTGRDVVLVVADATDPTADRVCAALAGRAARFFRFDTADIPQRLGLRAELGTTSWRGELVTAEDRVDLDEVGAVYVRRPRPFEPPAHLSAIEQWHSAIECRYALGGILASLDGVRWCNRPAHSADAAYKPKQLRDFRACGLATPPTLITNDAQAVRDFADQVGSVICKPVAVGVVRSGDRTHAVYTRRVTAQELEHLSGVDYSAHLFQSYVDALFSVRLTVVGEEFFAVRIDAGSDRARIDWRSDYAALSYRVIDTPPDIRAGVTAYMKMAGLAFGAFDFGVTAEGWWAYECNAEGQIGWLEAETGSAISEAIADFLLGGREP
jgi:ATP-grasp ribosomal peptide maturase